MLTLLHIENIALIESADISFHNGFNVLTGETGAGKSIVVDSLGAVLGQRTSRDLIRTGASSALVTAVFSGHHVSAWLEENGISSDDEELVLQRQLKADGKNVCRINGMPITTAQLKQVGQQLINIHGQHDGQQLLDPACHLDYLDHFGNHQTLLSKFSEQFEALSDLKTKIAKLEMDESARTRRIDTLKFQIAELESAQLIDGEDEKLDSQREILRNAEKLTSALQQAKFSLDGDDDSAGAYAQISAAAKAIAAISDYSAGFAQLSSQLIELQYAAENASELLRDIEQEFDFSPEELDRIESRLDTIYRLKKKYGATVYDMLAYLSACQDELDAIEDADDAIARLQAEFDKTLFHAQNTASELSKQRKETAANLQARVEAELKQLDMPNVRFETVFALKSGELSMDKTGCDEVQFFMSANTGENLKPIQKVASGGELARIMLALKNVLAQNDGIETLVFDEVDTGVSGRAAQKVAEKMSDLARYKQVLCVTHLPQIAAMADAHLRVEKGEHDGRTFTKVTELDFSVRKEEIARLFGGAHISDTILSGAEELLKNADTYKNV